MNYENFSNDDLTIRDLLALDRTILANERTLLAYARTSMMLVVSSVSLIKLFPNSEFANWTGIALIPIAIIIAVLGFRRYFTLSRKLLNRRRA